MRRGATIGICAAAGVVSFLIWGEIVSARASRRGLRPASPGAPLVVLVLGYGNRGERATAVNRYRARAAVRTATGPDDVVIASGGSVQGTRAEARILADAIEERGFRGRILVETSSRSTPENIENSIPLLERASQIAVVSNSLHAERARALLRARRPDLAERLVRGEEYRFGEIPVIKAVAAAMARLERWRPWRRGRAALSGLRHRRAVLNRGAERAA